MTVTGKTNQPQAKTETAPWYVVGDFIAGVDAGPPDLAPTRKYLLTLIHRHTHARQGFAWTSQKTLAREMGVGLRTVSRAFQWAKQLGIVTVRRVRTGKGKADQYNEYWLNLVRLKELQRPAEHPSPESYAESEHMSPMTGASGGEHTTPKPEAHDTNKGSTRHQRGEHTSPVS